MRVSDLPWEELLPAAAPQTDPRGGDIEHPIWKLKGRCRYSNFVSVVLLRGTETEVLAHVSSRHLVPAPPRVVLSLWVQHPNLRKALGLTKGNNLYLLPMKEVEHPEDKCMVYVDCFEDAYQPVKACGFFDPKLNSISIWDGRYWMAYVAPRR